MLQAKGWYPVLYELKIGSAYEGFNIHDVVVLPEYRGRGIGLARLDFIESEARARGACKLTLEVLQGNEAAKRVYSKKGYATYQLDPKMGAAEFWEKKLSD